MQNSCCKCRQKRPLLPPRALQLLVCECPCVENELHLTKTGAKCTKLYSCCSMVGVVCDCSLTRRCAANIFANSPVQCCLSRFLLPLSLLQNSAAIYITFMCVQNIFMCIFDISPYFVFLFFWRYWPFITETFIYQFVSCLLCLRTRFARHSRSL